MPWYGRGSVRTSITTLLARPDARWALLVVLVLAVVYGSTLCPTVYWYDSAELAGLARSLGVPHPPGYPLYTLIAHAFTWLPGEPALGVNVMSLVFGLASALACFGLGRAAGVRSSAAAVAALTLGVGRATWWNSVVAEVYMPGLTFTLGAMLLLLHAVRRNSLRMLWAAALVGGLGVGVHMSIATFGLGYLLLVASFGARVERGRDLVTLWASGWRTRAVALGGSALATALGLLVFLYVPLRTRAPDGSIDWAQAGRVISGGRFKALFLEDYELLERLGLVWRSFSDELSAVGLALAAVGLVVVGRRAPRVAAAFGLAIAGNVGFFLDYAVHDIEVFFLPSIALAAVLMGAGLDALARGLESRRVPHAVAVAGMLALPITSAVAHREHCDLSETTEVRDYAQRLIAEMPPRAQIVLYDLPFEWKRSAVLLYVREGLGLRGDVVIRRRLPLPALEAQVRAGVPLYGVVALKRVVSRPGLVMVPEGVLWRIRVDEAEPSPP